MEGDKLLRRLEQLKTRRSVVDEEWRKCYRYTYPLRGVGFENIGVMGNSTGQANASTATANQDELLDSTGTDSARTLASALMGGLTPANSRWPGLEVDDQTDEERKWLDNAAETIWLNVHASNYDAVGFECMQDVSVAGMFALFCDEAEEGGYRFEAWPLANCYFAASKPGGPIDTVYNEFPLSAQQAVNSYGIERVPEKIREAIEKDKPDEMFQFVRCVEPRSGPYGQMANRLPFASYHVEKDSKRVVRESGYHEMPLGVPRWNQIPGSAYAFGPTKEALPDLKTLNEVVKYDLSNMDMAIAGMWGAVDDGVLNPRTIRIGPRKVVVMAQKENFFPLTAGGDFKVAAVEIDRLQRAIRRVMMADQLEPQMKAGTPPTATEVMVRVELIRQLLGPVYGRMQSEFLQWLVRRCFGIGFRAGAFGPAPRSLVQKWVRIQYFSPLARAQKAADVSAMDRYEASLGAQAQAGLTDAMDVYDWDEARRHRAELLGVPAKLIPDEDAVQEKRDGRAKAQQAAQMQDLAKEAALGAVKQVA